MRAPLAPLWISAALAGCAEPRTVVSGALAPETVSLLVGLSQGNRLHAIAQPAAEPLEVALPADFDEDAPLRLTRVELGHPLGELGLPRGPVAPPSGPSHLVRDLPRLVTRSALVSLGEPAVLEHGPSDPRLEALSLDYPACPRFRVEEIPELALSGRAEGRAPLPGGGAVFGTVFGLVIARPEEAPFFVPLPNVYAGVAVAVSPEGSVWWVSNRTIGRYDLQTRGADFELPVPDGLCASALVVLRDEPGLAFVLDCFGRIWRLDGETWSVDYEIPEAQYVTLPFRRAQMFPLSPDEFLVGALNLGPILRYRAGTYRPELLEVAGRGFPAFLRDRRGRLLAVEYRGGLYLHQQETVWTPGPMLPPSSYAFAPLGVLDQLFFGTDSGAIGLFSPEAGVLCGPEQLGALVGATDVVELGHRFLLGGNLAGSEQPARWQWLTPE